MPRLTKQERELLAQLTEKAKAEDAEDSEYEVWVKNDKGHQVKLTGAKARKFMSQFGVDDDEEEIEEEEIDEEEEAENGKLPADKKPGGDEGGYFRRKG